MNNALQDCLKVSEESLRRLRPFIEELSGGRFVAIEGGPLAAYLQQRFGDLIVKLPNGVLATLECKAEKENTGNIFFEVYSNLVGSRSQHYERANKAGWGFTSRSTFLLYHFLDDDTLLVGDTLRIKRWAYGYWKNGVWHAGKLFRGGERGPDFPERPQGKYQQPNNTVGRLVKQRVLMDECGVVRLRVGQGELFEQLFTAAA